MPNGDRSRRELTPRCNRDDARVRGALVARARAYALVKPVAVAQELDARADHRVERVERARRAVKVVLVVAHARLPRRVANAHAVPNGYEQLGERPAVSVYSCGAPAARVLCALIGVVEEVRLVQRGRHICDLFDARDVRNRRNTQIGEI